MTTWKITDEEAGERLDLFLTTRLDGRSRSGIQKIIKQGQVTVNNKTVTVHHFLKTGDVVELHATAPIDPKDRLKKTPAAPQPPIKLPPLKIVDETDDYLVINKPIGMLVHPDAKTADGTLVDLLLKHDPSIAKVGADPARPGIVHRLDREVSGLMVLAKTQKAFDDLSKQFAQHSTEKKYLALVHGVPSKEEDDIKFRIARSTSQPRMAARPVNEKGGRAAWTHYVTKQVLTGSALLELSIFSGRMHQIRAHLFALGHPVIGDPLYKLKKPERKVSAPRLMLQSIGLTFTDPTTGKRKEYHLEPDPSFKTVITSLSS